MDIKAEIEELDKRIETSEANIKTFKENIAKMKSQKRKLLTLLGKVDDVLQQN